MIYELAMRLKRDHGKYIKIKLPHKPTKGGELFWKFGERIGAYLIGKFPHRTLTPQFLTELTADQLEILLHTMILGDGWGSKLEYLTSKKINDKISFCTGRKKQADAFQILCMLTGRACSVVYRDMSKYVGTGGRPEGMTGIWICNILRRVYVDTSFLKNKLIKNKGVWCPVVPNTYFVARRNGQPFITGNTPIQGAANHLMLMAMAMLKRKPKEFQKDILGVPGIDVHDFMGWWCELRNLIRAYHAGKKLLEEAPLMLIRKEYPELKWRVPLVVEGKVGLRYGDAIEIEGNESLEQIMLDMFFATLLNEMKLELELEKESV
jgi:hypothetical protein